jgi:hypothetical protein
VTGGRSDQRRHLDRHVETTTDTILAARRTVNGLLVSVAGLRSQPRLAGIAALAVAGGLSQLLPAYAALGLVATVLLVLIVTVVRERDATASRRLTHRPPGFRWIYDRGQAVAMK